MVWIRQFVSPDLCPNCLQRFNTDNSKSYGDLLLFISGGLTLCMMGNFSCFCYFKISFFKAFSGILSSHRLPFSLGLGL